MPVQDSPADRRPLPLLKRALYGAAAGVSVVLVLAFLLVLFPDPLLNSVVKPAIIRAFADEYPAYSLRIADMTYSIFTNRLGADSAEVRSVDGTVTGTVGALSVSGISWVPLVWGGELAPGNCAGAVVDMRTVVLALSQSREVLRCVRLRLSVPESTVVAESLAFHPRAGDEEYFEGSKFRTTRFIVAAPEVRVAGADFLALVAGASYRARSVRIQDLQLDVLINKDKPGARDTAVVRMPHEMMAAIQGFFQLDSVRVVNGRLTYGERFDAGATPAVITFDSIQVAAEGFADSGGGAAALVVHAEGRFMNAGTLTVQMSIPVGPPEFSFRYSGSLGRMDLRSLNPWLEPSDQMRIHAGMLHKASFEIDVVSGRASGTVRAVYRGLNLSAIDGRTGSDQGMGDRIVSFIANTFTIRGTNIPDRAGAMKLGEVSYRRKRDDRFFQFVWLALRSGVQDVVGW